MAFHPTRANADIPSDLASIGESCADIRLPRHGETSAPELYPQAAASPQTLTQGFVACGRELVVAITLLHRHPGSGLSQVKEALHYEFKIPVAPALDLEALRDALDCAFGTFPLHPAAGGQRIQIGQIEKEIAAILTEKEWCLDEVSLRTQIHFRDEARSRMTGSGVLEERLEAPVCTYPQVPQRMALSLVLQEMKKRAWRKCTAHFGRT